MFISILKRLCASQEPDDVYIALVRELFSGLVPTAIMGVVLVCVGLFLTGYVDNPPMVSIATFVGAILTFAKLGLMMAPRRHDLTKRWDRRRAGRWERLFALVSIGIALVVGTIAASTFRTLVPSIQMLGIGMLFGYCSGIVARTAIRPRLAIVLLVVATIPVIVSVASSDGTEYWMVAAMLATFLGASFESVRYVHNVASRQIALQLDMAVLARSDPLTGLRNRLGMREGFRELSHSPRHAAILAVHCFDLDGFKQINDQYGHLAGDELLRKLADRIRSTAKDSDPVGRIGGDEFVVIQSSMQRVDQADLYARQLSAVITAPYAIGGKVVHVGVSLGYATSPPYPYDLEVLRSAADAAMYQVKRLGGGVVCADTKTQGA